MNIELERYFLYTGIVRWREGTEKAQEFGRITFSAPQYSWGTTGGSITVYFVIKEYLDCSPNEIKMYV